MIDLALIYMGSAALIASGTTYFLTKKKKDDTFTIKSDRVRVEEDNPYGGYQPKAGPPKERPDAPPPPQSQPISPAPEMILDMRNVTGIIVEGSPTFELSDGHISVSEEASVKVKQHTLWISTRNDTSKVVAGMFISNFNHIKNEVLKTIPTINFVTTNLTRCSVQGSGDISILNSKVANEFDAIVQGSGDVELQGISTGSLSLSVQGSGDIKVGTNCKATTTFAKVQGSGDITITSQHIGSVSKQIQGSGDIHINGYKQGKVKKGKPTQTSYFHQSQTDGRYFNRTVTSTYEYGRKPKSGKPMEAFFQGVVGVLKE